MAWMGYSRFLSLLQWFWRKLLFVWRYFAPALYSVIGYARNQITWRKGRQDEGRESDFEAPADGGDFGPEDGETEPSELSMYGEFEQLFIVKKYM